MSDTAIIVDGISKRYRIGAAKERYVALRDVISRRVKRLFGRGQATPTSQDFWALRDVSFEVKRGECVGIIGRNGAGKSTLLKILSRITEPTEGEIRLRGRVGSLLEVGTGFHPELTGRENIYLNGAVLGMGRKEIARKFDEIVAFAEVEKFLETPVKYYSSGMYTRLAFAVAAHLEPEILIVDEVLAVGDAQFQQKCLGKMGEVTRQGRTVLFVSHNMQAVSTLCTAAIRLSQGCMMRSGDVRQVVSDYLSGVGDQQSSRWSGIDGDEHLAVLHTEVSANDETKVYQTDHEFTVRLRFRLTKPTFGVVCAVQVFNHSGSRLIYSAWDDQLPPPTEIIAPGVYDCKVVIPANTFSAGDFRFDFDLGIHNVRRVSSSGSALNVHIENLNGVGRRYAAQSDVIRPAWHWAMARQELDT